MADNNTVARPYAQAAFEVAQENNALAELSESFAVAKELLADGQVAKFLATPTLSDDERLGFLQGLFAKVAGEEAVVSTARISSSCFSKTAGSLRSLKSPTSSRHSRQKSRTPLTRL